MKSLRFEWDPAKAFTNAKKHGITFEEARTVFDEILPVYSMILITHRKKNGLFY
jgi:uncharacterized DUF497 family protein